MSYSEKSNWIVAVVVSVVYGGYLMTVLNHAAANGGLSEVAYVWPMISAWIASIAGIVVLHIAASIAAPKEAGIADERDTRIHRTGEYVGLYLVVLASVAGMGMAMLEVQHFWIANALYLGLMLSSLVSAVIQILAYRRGLPLW